MEEQFAALTIPDCRTPRSKLIRANSFSGLSSTNVQLVQNYSGADSASLVKQYSNRQASDEITQTSLIKPSNILRPSKDEHIETWSYSASCENPKVDRLSDNTKNASSVPKSTDSEIEYMEVDHLDSSTNQLNIAAPVASTTRSVIISEPLLSKSNEDIVKPILTEETLVEKENSDGISKNKRNPKSNKSYQDMKNKIRPLVLKHSMEKTNYCCMCFKVLFLILFFICVLLITILLQEDPNYKHSTDFSNAIGELKKQLYGQDEAVQTLSEYLQMDAPALKVIALVGGTGVGKSYTVKIIKSSFPRQHSIHQVYPPIDGTISDTGFFSLRPRLIILENLKEYDLKSVMNYLQTRDKLADEYTTILTVFNVEQMDDDSMRNLDLDESLKTIRDTFASENVDVKIIPYVPLSEDVLEKCIMNAARDSGLTLSDSRVDLVKESLLANNAGCKGAYSKVQVLGRQ